MGICSYLSILGAAATGDEDSCRQQHTIRTGRMIRRSPPPTAIITIASVESSSSSEQYSPS